MDLWFLYVNSAELPASFVIEQGGAHPVVVMQPTTYGNYNTLNIAPTQAQAAPVYTTAEYGGYSKTDASANVAIAGSSAAYAPVAQRVEVVSDNYDRNKNGSSRPSGVAENLNNTVVAPFAPARKMRITIPAGALPGQTITAISPDGVSVSVSIPSSVSPGQSVLVNY